VSQGEVTQGEATQGKLTQEEVEVTQEEVIVGEGTQVEVIKLIVKSYYKEIRKRLCHHHEVQFFYYAVNFKNNKLFLDLTEI
jgi:hypothetical protein